MTDRTVLTCASRHVARRSRSKRREIDTYSENGASPEASVTSDNESSVESDEESDGQWTPYIAPSHSSDDWEESYMKLLVFHSTFGHSVVPAKWDGNPELADWVCEQRQTYREIQQGYRSATLTETSRWKLLRELNFRLDYSDWHWSSKYNELVESLKGGKYQTNVSLLSPSLREWVAKQQKKHTREGAEQPLSRERRKKLSHLGVFDEDETSNNEE
jgi:hypothetical protein